VQITCMGSTGNVLAGWRAAAGAVVAVLAALLLGAADAQTGFNNPCEACRVEMGVADVTHDWTTITTGNAFSDPVLIVGLVTMNGQADAAARSQVVSGNTFQIKVTEPSCQDGFHAVETISWMVMEVSTRAGGEAGHIELGSDTPTELRSGRKTVGAWPVSFTESIPSPIVIASIMSANADGWYTARAHDAEETGFQISLQKEETLASEDAVAETIGYFAVTETTSALGTIGGFEYWATGTDRFDELGRCANRGRRLFAYTFVLRRAATELILLCSACVAGATDLETAWRGASGTMYSSAQRFRIFRMCSARFLPWEDKILP
jgi:hypothetical protein